MTKFFIDASSQPLFYPLRVTEVAGVVKKTVQLVKKLIHAPCLGFGDRVFLLHRLMLAENDIKFNKYASFPSFWWPDASRACLNLPPPSPNTTRAKKRG